MGFMKGGLIKESSEENIFSLQIVGSFLSCLVHWFHYPPSPLKLELGKYCFGPWNVQVSQSDGWGRG